MDGPDAERGVANDLAAQAERLFTGGMLGSEIRADTVDGLV